MKYTISIIELVTKTSNDHFIQLTDENGRICSEEQYENFLMGIGAECVKRY